MGPLWLCGIMPPVWSAGCIFTSLNWPSRQILLVPELVCRHLCIDVHIMYVYVCVLLNGLEHNSLVRECAVNFMHDV